jgi:hypothetical protein
VGEVDFQEEAGLGRAQLCRARGHRGELLHRLVTGGGQRAPHGAAGVTVHVAKSGLDADLPRQVRQEQHQAQDARDREHVPDRDRDLWHERRFVAVGVSHCPQHRERVGEGSEKQRKSEVHKSIAGEGAQQPWGELAAGQLQGDNRQREGERGDSDQTAGHGRQDLPGRFDAPSEQDAGHTGRQTGVDTPVEPREQHPCQHRRQDPQDRQRPQLRPSNVSHHTERVLRRGHATCVAARSRRRARHTISTTASGPSGCTVIELGVGPSLR